LTWLAFGWVSPAFPADGPAGSLKLAPIATHFWGDIGYDIEQNSYSGGSATLRQRIMLNLRGQGRTYISKPWIAQVLANISLNASENKYLDYSSFSHGFSGDAGLYLVPYSRYPFIASIARSQNFSGPGLGFLTDTSTRYRIDQSFRPKDGREMYQLVLGKTNTEYQPAGSFRDNELDLNVASNRFDHRSLTFESTSRRAYQTNPDKKLQSNVVYVYDRYRPNSQFTMENNAILRALYEDLPGTYVNTRDRELNSTMYYHGIDAPYSVLGTLRANSYDYDFNLSPSHSRTFNANLSVNYTLTQYVTLFANVNVNTFDNYSQRSTAVSSYQAATANYPLVSLDLDAYHYSSRISGNIGNSISIASGRSDSIQTVTVSPSHSLVRNFIVSGGSMNLRFDQSLTVNESSRSQPIARLLNSATANWRRTITTLRVSARDSRSLNSVVDSFQYFSIYGSINEEINRDSSLIGSVMVDKSRQISPLYPSSLTYTNSSFSIYYNHRRAFGVPRLQFASNLRTFSRTNIPALVAPPELQGPINWENTLSYRIGLLTADFKVSLTKNGDGSSQSLIWFSVKRSF
jgi:hypothetical protein